MDWVDYNLPRGELDSFELNDLHWLSSMTVTAVIAVTKVGDGYWTAISTQEPPKPSHRDEKIQCCRYPWNLKYNCLCLCGQKLQIQSCKIDERKDIIFSLSK